MAVQPEVEIGGVGDVGEGDEELVPEDEEPGEQEDLPPEEDSGDEGE